MNWRYCVSTEQNQQNHWCDDIAQCLGWITGCVFKFKTKLILVLKALEKGGERAEKFKIKTKDSTVLGSWLQVTGFYLKDESNNNIIILSYHLFPFVFSFLYTSKEQ